MVDDIESSTITSLPITDKIFDFNYFDTLNCTYYSISHNFDNKYTVDSLIYPGMEVIGYGKSRNLGLDTIKLIVLDSILGCGDSGQLQFMNSNEFNLIQSKKPVFYFKIADSSSQQWWLDFISYSPEWTKKRILNSVGFEKS
ncbi:MAG: hypothetical protein HC906_00450 [Bacteroidales bacterium]|nr:hypothetical protein [Bacteroidales bacterium]